MPTGGFIGYGPSLRTGGNAGAASIFLTPLVASQNGTATAVLLDGNTGASGISLKALIYDGSHSALLASGSAVTALANNYNRLPLTGNLGIVAGTTYYVGYVCNASCPVGVQNAGGPGAWWVSGGQSVPSPANPLVGGSSSGTTLMCALELDGASSPGFGWGPDFASGVTLSASNTTATFTSAVSIGARSILTHLPGDGKFYAEIDVGGTPTTGTCVGILSANCGITQGVPPNMIYQSMLNGAGIRYSGSVNLGLTFGAGDTVGVAYDGINNAMWWNKNNGSWFGNSSTAGNPVTATGGVAMVAVGWPFTINASNVAGTGAAATFLLRETAGALRYTPPSGFSPWSPATYPAVVSTQARAMVLA